MWGVDACDLDLACGELEELFEVAVADRSDEAMWCEVDRKFRLLQNTRDCEIVGDRSTPAFTDVELRKCASSDRSRTTPAKVLRSITAKRRRDRRIPNPAKPRCT